MFTGPKITQDGLLRAYDASSRRSTLRVTQTSNILPDPNNWTTGTGGQSGYSPNGSSSEQNRVVVNDDPWGRTSIVWRTTPDSASGPDGGWNSSYYSVDTNFTYRYSVWVRRHTSGTGGNFYLGMNPAPIRNDNGAVQGNPYWHCPTIASLAFNQWYLVVAHCFYQGYTGGRHPESGWYANGAKVGEIGFCNVGGADVRWNPGTTTAMHRAYHFYTTNVNSGIEFAFPRIDKCDGTEPSIDELLNVGESGWVDVKNSSEANLLNGINHVNSGASSYFNLDGTDDYILTDFGSGRNPSTQPFTVEAWVRNNSTVAQMWVDTGGNGSNQRFYSTLINGSTRNFGIQNVAWSDSTPNDSSNWHHQAIVMDGSTARGYDNGIQVQTQGYSSYTLSGNIRFGGRNTAYSWNGPISQARIYDRALSANEILSNYNAMKGRFV